VTHWRSAHSGRLHFVTAAGLWYSLVVRSTELFRNHTGPASQEQLHPGGRPLSIGAFALGSLGSGVRLRRSLGNTLCGFVHPRNGGLMAATRQATSKATEIRLAHSPDSDDAFMFYALATRKVRTPGLKIVHVLADIETLNRAADEELYDVTAISFAAYPYLREKYVLLDCGASFGEGYGPMVVASHPLRRDELAGKRIAVPGQRTSAYLTLKLFEPNFDAVTVAFDKILDAVHDGTVDAGLIIHEGQLLYAQQGLHRVVDLGQWWQEQTGLPLPLGGNAIRRALGPEIGRQVARAIRESVSYALEHREPALNYALQFARDMDPDMADKFIGMYVNRWTLAYGDDGRKAVRELLSRGAKAGLISVPAEPEFLIEEGD
jgi:1,4-dihydroxy-6-naphthoate synthase